MNTRVRTKKERKQPVVLDEITDLVDWDFVDAIGDYIFQETSFVNVTMRLAILAERLKDQPHDTQD